MHVDFEDKKVQFIIGGVLVVILFFGWVIFGRTPVVTDGSLLSEVGQDPIEDILGRELLMTLEKMKNVELDTAFLNDPVYLSLTDISVEVPEMLAGRRNPFAPLGYEGSDGKNCKTSNGFTTCETKDKKTGKSTFEIY